MNAPVGQNAGDAVRVAPKWKPISAIQRRILGVLGEKAKTTPDQYPLTLNALTNGCKQKSNRSPQMNLEPIQIEDALEQLRAMGAVSEVQGGGRVAKFRHYLYEWLGVDKTECAVMIELLLRGSQTVGELRGRAARMEPIDDIAALRPILNALIDRGLVISLTPEGRGQMVTHALYLEREMDKVRSEIVSMATASPDESLAPTASDRVIPSTTAPPAEASASDDVQRLSHEVQQLRTEVVKLRSEIEDVWANIKG